MKALEDGPILAVLPGASGPFVRGERAGIFGLARRETKTCFAARPGKCHDKVAQIHSAKGSAL
jgi:hypothetical protein